MNGVNLRLASLKGASMKLCGLRFADMAGTDLEVEQDIASSLTTSYMNQLGVDIKRRASKLGLVAS